MNRWKAQCLESGHAEFGGRLPGKGPGSWELGTSLGSPPYSACGYLLAELSLGTRHWTCPSCGARHDRDNNAATNILAAGQAVTACGADVRHSGTSRVQSAVKQEPRPVTAGIPILQGGE